MIKFILSCLAAATMAEGNIEFTSIGRIHTTQPGYTHITKFHDSEDFLMTTRMNSGFFPKGSVSIVPNIKQLVKEQEDVSGVRATRLNTKKFKAVNNAKVVPREVFNDQRAIAVPDGFLIPWKRTGGVYILKINSRDVTDVTDTIKISADVQNYFYTEGYWYDMNGDGRKDYLTARSNARAGGGQLVWFEHPEDGLNHSGPWTEHFVVSGPEMLFEVHEFPEFPGELVIFSAEYYNKRLAMYRVETNTGNLVQGEGSWRVIDDQNIYGASSIQLVDLNNDGNKQLLASNFDSDPLKNGVFAYTVPTDKLNGTYDRYVIASGFEPYNALFFTPRAPGFPYAVWPDGKQAGERAQILVAGSGAQKAYHLQPVGDAASFEYQSHVIGDYNGIIPALATADLDDDGWLEMYMPNFQKNYIEVFKLSERN